MKTDRIQGFLIDIAWLWEEYLTTVIGDYFIHPNNRNKSNANYYFAGQLGEIYPDFISKGNIPVIADAKYKGINSTRTADYHQILAYIFRFNTTDGYLIYPSSDKRKKTSLKLLDGVEWEDSTKERRGITVYKIAVHINKQSETYDDFVRAMKDEEKVLLKALRI